jgi:hypothetical protein
LKFDQYKFLPVIVRYLRRLLTIRVIAEDRWMGHEKGKEIFPNKARDTNPMGSSAVILVMANIYQK